MKAGTAAATAAVGVGDRPKGNDMGSVNKVILVGNLGRDAELRYTPGGAAVATLNLATTEVWNDRNNQRQEKTEWHRIVLWGTSWSGGHSVYTAADDPRIAAVIAQTPDLDGARTLVEIGKYAGPGQLLRLGNHGFRDWVEGLRGHEHHLIPIVGPPGTIAAMSSEEAEPGYKAIAGPTWRNEICARADVAQKTFFNHFPTKHHVVREIAEGFLDELGVLVEEARKQPGTTAQRLTHLFQRTAEETLRAGPRHKELLIEVVRVAQVDGPHPERTRRFHAAFRALLEDGAAAGELTRGHDVAFLTAIVFKK